MKHLPGATSTTPVVLAAGEGRQFTSPGYDGSTGYGNQAKCVWTFAPATGATLTFSCSAFDLTATSAVGDKCTGLARYPIRCLWIFRDILTSVFKRRFHASVRPGGWQQPGQQWGAILSHNWTCLLLLLGDPGPFQHQQRCQRWHWL